MLALTIHHNIRLTKEERYKIHEGKKLIVIGVSVPVWFLGKTTSEPAKEVFCKYHIRNPKKEVPIRILNDGYEITLPHREGSIGTLTNEQWRSLSNEERDMYYTKCVSEVSSKNLLDVKDGGSKYLFYREQNQIKQDGEMMSIMHYVNIGDINEMTH